MDIPKAKNKMIDSAENKADQPTTIRAVSPTVNEYFFPGGGVWQPMSVRAATREDAEAVYKEKREPVQPASPAEPEQAKVEPNETNE